MASQTQEPEMDPVPGAPSDNTTATSVLEDLRQQGYDGDFVVREGPVVCCRTCDHCVEPEDLQIDAFRRLEGASEPDEMSVVVAVRCRECGEKGSLLIAYGPNASELDADLLVRLDGDPKDRGTTDTV
jgi:hypothetical protein